MVPRPLFCMVEDTMEKLTWWQGLLIFTAVTSTGLAFWSAFKGSEAVTRAVESLQGPPPYKVPGPLISVVIPTWNEADSLPNLLTSLHNQTYEPLEIIVADYCESTDGTKEVAKSLGAIVVDVPERGVGPARNLGAAAAHGDFLLFIDGDNILEPNLVEQLMVELLATDAKLAHPRIAYYEDGIYPAVRWVWNSFMPNHYTTRCVLITREAFELTGGYPNIWREDLWLGRKVKELFGGDRIAYLPNAICATSTRRERAQLEGRVKQIKSPEFAAVRDGVYYG